MDNHRVVVVSEEVLSDTISLAEFFRQLEQQWWERYESEGWNLILYGPHYDHPNIIRSEN